MAFIKGHAITGFPFGLVDKTTGDSITTGTPVIYITIDGGDQKLATHLAVHEGNGQWTINLNGNETNGDVIGILITHPLAITQNFALKMCVQKQSSIVTSFQTYQVG